MVLLTYEIMYDSMSCNTITGEISMKWLLKILFFFIKIIWWILKHILGWIFGWIPDLKKNMSGQQFEEYVQEILKRNGYKHVQLTKRTGDYGIDILADKKGVHYAIQCKYYSKPVGVSAVQQAYSGCQYYECDEAIVITNHSFTNQAHALASSNGVRLWDGKKLDQMKVKANSRSLFYRFSHQDVDHPYQEILQLLLEEGYACDELLYEKYHIPLAKAYYILDELEFYNLVSCEDEYGMRELYFASIEEALELLDE